MVSAKTVILIALCCGATAGFLSWRYLANRDLVISHSLEILDRSESVTELERGAEFLQRKALKLPGVRRGSTLTILATGDASTAYEPILVARYDAPVSRRAIGHKAAEETRREEIVSDLVSRVGNLKRTRTSPIFIAVKRGVEQLRANGCTPEITCHLFVKTDGKELVDPAIKEALRGGTRKKGFPTPLDNRGISITFCGLSETFGDMNEGANKRSLTPMRDHQRLDRMRVVWSALFTNPESVSFEPFCGRVGIVRK